MTGTPVDRAAAARVRMAELAVKFTERTRRELDVLRARLSALGAGDTAALAEMRHLAHRICGTGATLGFHALADGAQRLEKLVVDCAGGAGLDPEMLSRLAGAIDALGAELDQPPRG